MYFDNFTQLFTMQGHGGYVWVSFGLFWALLGLNIGWAKVQHKQLYRKVLAQAKQRRDQSAQTDNLAAFQRDASNMPPPTQSD